MRDPYNIKKDKEFDIMIKLNSVKGKSQKEITRVLGELFNKYEIYPSAVQIKDCEKYQKCPKVTLKNFEKILGYNKKELLNQKSINWYMLSKYVPMSEGFINFAHDNLIIPLIIARILKGELKVSKKFMKDNMNDFNDYTMEMFDECDILSDDYGCTEFYSPDAHQSIIEDKLHDKYKNRNGRDYSNFNFNGEIQHLNNIHDNSIQSIIPTSYLADMENIKNNLAKTLNVNPDDIMFFDPSMSIYNSNVMNYDYDNIPESQKVTDIKDKYIDLDNYKEILTDIDNYDTFMWSWVSEKLWLSPEFVDKFWDNIVMKELIKNAHFSDIMKCDWFFDKYINSFRKLNKSSSNKIKNKIILDVNNKFIIPSNEF